MTLPFHLPPPRGQSNVPSWMGTGFSVGGNVVPVLEYSENFAGWSDDLTALHEEAAGDSHPIDIASRADAVAQLRANLGGKRCPSILEIGCSSGFMLKAIKEAFPEATIVGADVVREPLYTLAKQMPGIPLMRFDLLQCPLPSASFHAIVMLNVLEHIEDDISALKQVHRLLKPAGIAIIEVPAGPHLYDAYDEALCHFRRYDSEDLVRKLDGCGLFPIRKSHLGFLAYPAFAYTKRRNQKKRARFLDLSDIVRKQASSTARNVLLRLVFFVESSVGRVCNYPWGIRCLVVARKGGAYE